MFIPVGTINQAILQVDKDEHGKVTTKELFNVMVRTLLRVVHRFSLTCGRAVRSLDGPQAMILSLQRGQFTTPEGGEISCTVYQE